MPNFVPSFALRAVSALAFASIIAPVTSFAAETSVAFQGDTYVNKGLVGVARVPSNAIDKFGDTLGGFGSGMAVQPGSWHKKGDGSFTGTLQMMPDRGWNTAGSVDYFGRMQKFKVTLNPFYGASTTDQNQLIMEYKGAKRLQESAKLTTGLDPNGVRPAAGGLPALPIGSNGRISVDDETLVMPGDGTMWISDEYGPYIYHYKTNGTLLSVIRPPEAFIPKRLQAGTPVDDFSSNNPPIGTTYNKGNPVSGRQNNQGFEGMAISPDHTKLFVLLQSALIQDLNATSAATIRTTRRNTRFLTYDISGATPTLIAEYMVQLPQFSGNLTAAQSELLALNDHQFLVIARDSGAGYGLPVSTSVYRKVILLDTDGATNIAGTDYDLPTKSAAPGGTLDPLLTPVTWVDFIDINDNAELNRFGLHNGEPQGPNNLYEKWEGLAVVSAFDKTAPNDYFLFVASDNDYFTQDGHMVGMPYADASGANVDLLVLVYRVTLPTYVKPIKGAPIPE